MLRNWAARFSKSLSKRSSSRRLDISVPIKLTVQPNKSTGPLSPSLEGLTIAGETKDFSKSGIGFVVSCIRLREFYLVGEGRMLKAEVSLPNGIVRMTIMGLRYEQTGQHLSVSQYLVGAEIVEMSDDDRGIYEEFLGGRKERGGTLHLETEKS